MSTLDQPNFLFIGPDKTGSSWLYELLKCHPQCFVPDCKDIYFFDRYYSRGLGWYRSFFKAATNEHIAVGELSHDYMFSSEALERIKLHFPDIKLITSLRNPIDRSFSHYLYLVRSGMTKLPFREALVEYPEIIDHSLYYKHLHRWVESFGHENLKVLWFDTLIETPREFGEECLGFLGLSTVIDFDFQKKVRIASKPRSFYLAKLLKAGANLARFMRMEELVGKVKHSKVVGCLYAPYTKKDKPVCSVGDRHYLNDLFQTDIERLEKLFEVDLKHWLRER